MSIDWPEPDQPSAQGFMPVSVIIVDPDDHSEAVGAEIERRYRGQNARWYVHPNYTEATEKVPAYTYARLLLSVHAL